MSCIDHKSGSANAGSNGSVVVQEIDIRPLVVAIREMAASLKDPDEPREIVVHTPPPTVSVTTEKPVVNVSLPEICPQVNVKVPESPPASITVCFPVWPFVLCAVPNTLALLVLIYKAFRG